jgi:hypothetical protein
MRSATSCNTTHSRTCVPTSSPTCGAPSGSWSGRCRRCPPPPRRTSCASRSKCTSSRPAATWNASGAGTGTSSPGTPGGVRGDAGPAAKRPGHLRGGQPLPATSRSSPRPAHRARRDRCLRPGVCADGRARARPARRHPARDAQRGEPRRPDAHQGRHGRIHAPGTQRAGRALTASVSGRRRPMRFESSTPAWTHAYRRVRADTSRRHRGCLPTARPGNVTAAAMTGVGSRVDDMTGRRAAAWRNGARRRRPVEAPEPGRTQPRGIARLRGVSGLHSRPGHRRAGRVSRPRWQVRRERASRRGRC